MFTQIKLSDGNIWHAEQDLNDATCFRLADTTHNRDLWKSTDSQFCPGMAVLRRKAVIVGFVHTMPEQWEAQRLNLRPPQRRAEIRREHQAFTFGAVAKCDWSKLQAV